MAFLDDFDALDPATQAKERAGLVGKWLADRTEELFAELRAKRPILVAPGTCVVTRHPDVREVLATDRVFTVRPYTARMERSTGAFFLGMPRNAQYDRELAAMRLAADRSDLPRVAAIARGTAEGLIGAAKGRLDLARGYARRVALRVIADYFGTPGPDEATTAGWLAALFRDIFLNLGNDPAVTAAATAAGAGLRAYLEPLVAARRAKSGPETDVFSRLARLSTADGYALDVDGVCRNIGGTIVGASETVSKAFVQAIDQLLDRPAGLAQAQAAAAAGDDKAMTACVWEAMRFRPQNPFLYRLCEEDYTLARGTDHATAVPKGTLVFAATSSAMMDEAFVPAPAEFRPGRPPESYLFFGHALHTCFGEFVSAVEFCELARPLLKLPNLRRAAGADGQIAFDGPFPASLWVEYG